MAGQELVRRIALGLPEVTEEDDRFAFSVRAGGKAKGICWVWLERLEPKKARVPQPAVLGVRVASLDDKERLLASGPGIFFTEPHYDGYPAVLVRLAEIGEDELRELITDAWRCQAPRRLVKAFDAE
ncbi:MmcQ/YjbR family DNA-binding protein [Longispora albida]|uniref:MmcQ/YjbR family DNA-binding protein n=1 Tax=Longispora albida TaxID=203523 RepID=UPI0003A595C6|nr:MmcQ/YjbR family DNA-binding protein [Longispora albida]